MQEISAQQDGFSASVRIRRNFLNSTLEQTITIYEDARGIDFDLRADWHGHHVFLKTAFPVDILSDKATYEIQYGAVERPAHQNTSWDAAKFEVCAQMRRSRWALPRNPRRRRICWKSRSMQTCRWRMGASIRSSSRMRSKPSAWKEDKL